MTDPEPAMSHPAALFTATPIPQRSHVVVSVLGDLELASCDVLERQVEELCASGWRHVVVDLSEVPFIDSSGLRTLMVLRNDLLRSGCRLELVRAQGRADRIFDLTATRGLFEWAA